MQSLAKLRQSCRILLSVLGFSILTGCTGFETRRGLAPVLDAGAVELASANKARLLSALARDAGFPAPVAGIALPVPSPLWYYAARAGFNVVDDQCRAYFYDLFFLNRGREQAKTGIVAAGQTAAAILGITGASNLSLGVLAQAVGFGVNATDVVAGTYLYQLPPAATHGFVQQLQSAFRDAAAAEQALITTPDAAYYLVQRYLDLCLPPRIEAELTKQISSTTAVGVQQGRGAFFQLETLKTPPGNVMITDPPPREEPALREVPPPVKRRGRSRHSPQVSEQCDAGDSACNKIIGYLFKDGLLSIRRQKQLKEALNSSDPALGRRLFAVAKGKVFDTGRKILIDEIDINPIGP